MEGLIFGILRYNAMGERLKFSFLFPLNCAPQAEWRMVTM